MRSMLPVLLVIVLAVLLSLAAAVGVVLWMAEPGEETTAVLTYEVDPDRTSRPGRVDLGELVEAIDRRLNPSWSRLALVRRVDAARIEITVLSRDPRAVGQVERLLGRVGHLEIRQLANSVEHSDLIKQARDQEGPEVRSPAGKLLGEWVPLADGAGNYAQAWGYSEPVEIAQRSAQRGARKIQEALVVADQSNVDGSCLEKVAAGATDDGRQPCVAFELTDEGARQLAGMAGTSTQPFMQIGQLAIILDGQIVTTTAMQFMAGSRGQIIGSLSRQEVNDLVEILNSGPLPAAVRRVDQR